ncbi:hypothetical protein L9F63_008859, partial [Diploptera punctata]
IPIFPLSIFHTPLHHGIIYSLIPCSSTSSPSPSVWYHPIQHLFRPLNVLRELEQKKPQLDELVHTAENLKADSNRQQLHGK